MITKYPKPKTKPVSKTAVYVATGRQDAELEAFVDFVWECIWVPLVVNCD